MSSPDMMARRTSSRLAVTMVLAVVAVMSGMAPLPATAQDIVSSQLRQGFGMNKVRYKDFDWHFVESEHLLLHYEPEFAELADRAL
ncbi:MAG: hypothetical protein O2782_21450, partial [bacterium]|nr:hypothetical protein [bacterium]